MPESKVITIGVYLPADTFAAVCWVCAIGMPPSAFAVTV